MGVVALLLALLLPTLSSARAAARRLTCASNLRQICCALHNYATDYPSWFPPNITKSNLLWFQHDRAGKFLVRNGTEARGLPVTCPDDPDAIRSYAMNFWASSAVDGVILSNNASGRPWNATTRGASRLILVTERWSNTSSAGGGWAAQATISGNDDTPGHRFGGGNGLKKLVAERPPKFVNCELPYVRHRPSKGPGTGTDPVGRVNIGYADGHVALRSNDDLVTPGGLSTLDSWWTPLDADLNH